MTKPPKKVMLTVEIPAELHRTLKIEAAKRGTTIVQLVIAGLSKVLPKEAK